jgi:hypothetical protein
MMLHGRLGNQLFSFATGYACAQRSGSPLLFYDAAHSGTGSYEFYEAITPRPLFARPRDLLQVGHYDFGTPLGRSLSALSWSVAERRANRARSPRLIIQERLGSPFAPHEEVFAALPPVLFVGYFQSERYFDEYAAEVNAAITLPPAPASVMERLPRPVVSITFRRGDYANFGWTLPLAYYGNAIEYCNEHLSPGSLLIFSDDPQFVELAAPWLRGQAQVPTHLATSHTRDPLTQLAMIAACDHHIVANSTFCWWGAWLGEQRATAPCTVIAPAGWLDGDEGILPERWVRVPTRAPEAS